MPGLRNIILWIGLVTLMSCAPKIRTNVYHQFPELDFDQQINLLSQTDPLPSNATRIGEVKVTDSGASTNCDLELVLDYAKYEARKIGGNLLKITHHQPPGFQSSCHQIEADIYRVDGAQVDDGQNWSVNDTMLADSVDYALLYVFRPQGNGSLVGYNLHFGDSMIYRVKNNSREVFKIRKKGLNRIWAKTESLVEVGIDIEFGKEYFLNCGVTGGIMVGRPELELVDKRTGLILYNSIEP